MTQPIDAASRWPQLLVWLREELAPKPGRGAAVARIAVTCAITVAVGMVFQIPLPAYMVYLVFLVSREEMVATLTTAVGGIVAGTLAVALSLLLFTFDASEPALRLPLMAASTFLGMLLARVSPLGPIAFLASFVLVLTQTLIDDIPSPEALTRLVLWLWVVVMLPAVLTTLVDLALGRNPAKLARQTALRLLDTVTATLDGRHSNGLAREQSQALELLELRQHAQVADRRLRERARIDHRLIGTLLELLTLLRALPADTPREIRGRLADASRRRQRAFASDHAPAPTERALPDALLSDLPADVRPVVIAIGNALDRLGEGIARRRAEVETPGARSATSLFVQDAWSNPEHVRFALKTTIAVMAAYIIYTALDWPGIRTAVTTCFFVALGSVGETMHKAALRISGALIGGLAAGLCIVYLLPHMTDIGQLSVLIAAASAVSAWVATSSERLSYAGMQMAFAFFLGVLQGSGPTTDLTVLRDRMVGILLGNVLMSIVFSVIWPTSALDRARAMVAQALRTLGQLVSEAIHPQTDTRLAAVDGLTRARHFTSIAFFEANFLRPPDQEYVEQTAVSHLDRLARVVFVVAAQPSDERVGETVGQQDAATSAWFAETARRFAAGEAPPPAPMRAAIAQAQASLPPTAPPSLRAAIEARALLQKEIENAASTPA
jgi:multidrug resistance protein MdtO